MSKSRRLWSLEEDNILRTLVQAYENDKVDWRVIASYLPGRNNKDCRKRWHYRVAASMNLGAWSPAEDELLKAGIRRYGKHALTGISAGHVWHRWLAPGMETSAFKRWNDALNPSIIRSPWTQEEDRRLLLAIRQYGRSWKQIVDTYFPGRTGLDAKNSKRRNTRDNDRDAHVEGSSSRIDQTSLEMPAPLPSRRQIQEPPSTSQDRVLPLSTGSVEPQLEPPYDERCLSAPPCFHSGLDLEEWSSTIFASTPYTTRSDTPMTTNHGNLLDFDHYYPQQDAMSVGVVGYDHPGVSRMTKTAKTWLLLSMSIPT
ncbi:hypothetical protein VTN96DRAFT_825 [Rasamsonia emersonii]